MKRTATPTPPRGVLTGAGRGVTWALTTAAAVFTFLINARNLGITDWFAGTTLSFADHAAQRIVVTPRADSLFSVGDTTMLAATVTDRLGSVLVGARLRWESHDSTVVAVDSSGEVVARGPGRTQVTASVRDKSASATVSVLPRPARVIIPGDSALIIRQGDTLQLAAVALDGRGHRIAGAQPRWRSADSTVVRVDSVGTAMGVEAGLTRLRAVAGESQAELSVRVELSATGLVVVSGAGQRAPAGQPLAEPIVLRAHAARGQPVPGIVVRFGVREGDGRVEPDSAVTDRDGRVSLNWNLGPRAGLQQLTARTARVDSIVRLTADADPVPGNVLMELARGDTSATAGLAVGTPVRVRVTDSSGVALDGVPVRWTVLDGGSVTGEARTDSLGFASAAWTMGPRAGRQRLLAQVGSARAIAPLRIALRALPGAPTLVALEGQAQRGTVGRPLPKPVGVAVRDGLGNPVPGIIVTPIPDRGSGSAEPVVTDAKGRAGVAWTLGTSAGKQALKLRIAGLDSSFAVHAVAAPAAPAAPVRTGGNLKATTVRRP